MIIANRSLHLRQGEKDVEVPISISAPQADGNAWSCDYEIDWPAGTRKAAACGFDAAQALLFAFQMIGAEIYTSDYHKAGQLVWTEPQAGYGFPVPQNLRDLLIGDDARYL